MKYIHYRNASDGARAGLMLRSQRDTMDSTENWGQTPAPSKRSTPNDFSIVRKPGHTTSVSSEPGRVETTETSPRMALVVPV